jgi:ribosome production factor 2
MLQRKPKTAAGTRAMKKKESVADESAKSAIFLKGTNTSQIVSDCLKDLYSLKKPDAKMFSKKNDINPFEDAKQFEFLSLKNDASLFMFANHSKKRMHNLTLTRMFDHSLLDMIELGIQRFTKMSDFKAPKISLGFRPLICFRGEHWDSSDELRTIKSILLDFYTGDTSADMLDLSHGITHSMVFTLIGTPDAPCRILLNVYNIKLLKNEQDEKKPKVELEECGPFVEFIQRRCTLANPDMIKEAMRLPKMNQVRDLVV